MLLICSPVLSYLYKSLRFISTIFPSLKKLIMTGCREDDGPREKSQKDSRELHS